ncbi:hypothetical protein [Lewinella sp. W8]|uniref:hypothetical protein n=1 Tax=Lewinella sp. W8 TaxID=2528208 RepID=UPI0010673B95|nr:hypothetical protein [Lewinella sp. W8]MTB53494.1 hypothetical protein [Lewinella sp. W8]
MSIEKQRGFFGRLIDTIFIKQKREDIVLGPEVEVDPDVHGRPDDTSDTTAIVEDYTGFFVKGFGNILSNLFAYPSVDSTMQGRKDPTTEALLAPKKIPLWEAKIEDQITVPSIVLRYDGNNPIYLQKDDFTDIQRIGFKVWFEPSEQHTINRVIITQVISFNKDVEYEIPLGNSNNTYIRSEVQLISEFNVDGSAFDKDNPGAYGTDWVCFSPAGYTTVKGKQFPGDTEEELMNRLRKIDPSLLDDSNVFMQFDENDQVYREIYAKLIDLPIPGEGRTRLQYWKSGKRSFDFAFFSEFNFSLLHGKMSMINQRHPLIAQIGRVADVVFTGAKICLGQTAGGLAQVERIGLNDGVRPGPEAYDFTLKAEVVYREGINPYQNATQNSENSGPFYRFDTNQAQDDEPSDPTHMSESTVYQTELPLLVLAHPCPEVWEMRDGRP